ncbi:DUF2059 domain-containing protein [Sedimentitalea sp. HM32M-2]|uniref:DUF2059 domain-containing protein n=1 Tax=Sedimentitalea sp. HM32M-2 TaxID=3351566 RepID=UPI003634DABB
MTLAMLTCRRIGIGLAILMLCCAALTGSPARAADRERILAFLDVTGFDVALDSIALSTRSVPRMLGVEADDFGAEWDRVCNEVFAAGLMRSMALDILEQTLTDTLLRHAADFYASDLGRRLVVAENQSHMVEDDDAKQAEGTRIVAELVADGNARLELLKRMNRAIDAAGTSLHALQQIQMRFLLAASAAGVVELQMDAEELQAMFKAQEGELRRLLQASALAGAAYTYRDFSDADLTAYVQALEQPEMMQVYELLNAVQYEITADRLEALAARMADLHPGQDI